MKLTLLNVGTYLLIFFGVLLWSGKQAYITLYDRLNVTLEGALVPYTEYERTLKFYRDVLDFEPIENPENAALPVVGFVFPGNRKILIEKTNTAGSDQQARPMSVLLKLRKGLVGLRQKLLARSAEVLRAQSSVPGPIDEIRESAWGKEFAVTDPDGNRLIFFEPNRRRGSRY